MLFASLRRIAQENRYVSHPLHLNTSATIEKWSLTIMIKIVSQLISP